MSKKALDVSRRSLDETESSSTVSGKSQWRDRALDGTIANPTWQNYWNQMRARWHPVYLFGWAPTFNGYWEEDVEEYYVEEIPEVIKEVVVEEVPVEEVVVEEVPEYSTYTVLHPVEEYQAIAYESENRQRKRKSAGGCACFPCIPLCTCCFILLGLLLLAAAAIPLLLHFLKPADSKSAEKVGQASMNITLYNNGTFNETVTKTTSKQHKTLKESFEKEIKKLFSDSDKSLQEYFNKSNVKSITMTNDGIKIQYNMYFNMIKGEIPSERDIRDILLSVERDEGNKGLGLLGALKFYLDSVWFKEVSKVSIAQILSQFTSKNKTIIISDGKGKAPVDPKDVLEHDPEEDKDKRFGTAAESSTVKPTTIASIKPPTSTRTVSSTTGMTIETKYPATADTELVTTTNDVGTVTTSKSDFVTETTEIESKPATRRMAVHEADRASMTGFETTSQKQTLKVNMETGNWMQLFLSDIINFMFFVNNDNTLKAHIVMNKQNTGEAGTQDYLQFIVNFIFSVHKDGEPTTGLSHKFKHYLEEKIADPHWQTSSILDRSILHEMNLTGNQSDMDLFIVTLQVIGNKLFRKEVNKLLSTALLNEEDLNEVNFILRRLSDLILGTEHSQEIADSTNESSLRTSSHANITERKSGQSLQFGKNWSLLIEHILKNLSPTNVTDDERTLWLCFNILRLMKNETALELSYTIRDGNKDRIPLKTLIYSHLSKENKKLSKDVFDILFHIDDKFDIVKFLYMLNWIQNRQLLNYFQHSNISLPPSSDLSGNIFDIGVAIIILDMDENGTLLPKLKENAFDSRLEIEVNSVKDPDEKQKLDRILQLLRTWALTERSANNLKKIPSVTSLNTGDKRYLFWELIYILHLMQPGSSRIKVTKPMTFPATTGGNNTITTTDKNHYTAKTRNEMKLQVTEYGTVRTLQTNAQTLDIITIPNVINQTVVKDVNTESVLKASTVDAEFTSAETRTVPHLSDTVVLSTLSPATVNKEEMLRTENRKTTLFPETAKTLVSQPGDSLLTVKDGDKLQTTTKVALSPIQERYNILNDMANFLYFIVHDKILKESITHGGLTNVHDKENNYFRFLIRFMDLLRNEANSSDELSSIFSEYAVQNITVVEEQSGSLNKSILSLPLDSSDGMHLDLFANILRLRQNKTVHAINADQKPYVDTLKILYELQSISSSGKHYDAVNFKPSTDHFSGLNLSVYLNASELAQLFQEAERMPISSDEAAEGMNSDQIQFWNLFDLVLSMKKEVNPIRWEKLLTRTESNDVKGNESHDLEGLFLFLQMISGKTLADGNGSFASTKLTGSRKYFSQFLYKLSMVLNEPVRNILSVFSNETLNFATKKKLDLLNLGNIIISSDYLKNGSILHFVNNNGFDRDIIKTADFLHHPKKKNDFLLILRFLQIWSLLRKAMDTDVAGKFHFAIVQSDEALPFWVSLYILHLMQNERIIGERMNLTKSEDILQSTTIMYDRSEFEHTTAKVKWLNKTVEPSVVLTATELDSTMLMLFDFDMNDTTPSSQSASSTLEQSIFSWVTKQIPSTHSERFLTTGHTLLAATTEPTYSTPHSGTLHAAGENNLSLDFKDFVFLILNDVSLKERIEQTSGIKLNDNHPNFLQFLTMFMNYSLVNGKADDAGRNRFEMFQPVNKTKHFIRLHNLTTEINDVALMDVFHKNDDEYMNSLQMQNLFEHILTIFNFYHNMALDDFEDIQLKDRFIQADIAKDLTEQNISSRLIGLFQNWTADGVTETDMLNNSRINESKRSFEPVDLLRWFQILNLVRNDTNKLSTRIKSTEEYEGDSGHYQLWKSLFVILRWVGKAMASDKTFLDFISFTNTTNDWYNEMFYLLMHMTNASIPENRASVDLLGKISANMSKNIDLFNLGKLLIALDHWHNESSVLPILNKWISKITSLEDLNSGTDADGQVYLRLLMKILRNLGKVNQAIGDIYLEKAPGIKQVDHRLSIWKLLYIVHIIQNGNFTLMPDETAGTLPPVTKDSGAVRTTIGTKDFQNTSEALTQFKIQHATTESERPTITTESIISIPIPTYPTSKSGTTKKDILKEMQMKTEPARINVTTSPSESKMVTEAELSTTPKPDEKISEEQAILLSSLKELWYLLLHDRTLKETISKNHKINNMDNKEDFATFLIKTLPTHENKTNVPEELGELVYMYTTRNKTIPNEKIYDFLHRYFSSLMATRNFPEKDNLTFILHVMQNDTLFAEDVNPNLWRNKQDYIWQLISFLLEMRNIQNFTHRNYNKFNETFIHSIKKRNESIHVLGSDGLPFLVKNWTLFDQKFDDIRSTNSSKMNATVNKLQWDDLMYILRLMDNKTITDDESRQKRISDLKPPYDYELFKLLFNITQKIDAADKLNDSNKQSLYQSIGLRETAKVVHLLNQMSILNITFTEKMKEKIFDDNITDIMNSFDDQVQQMFVRLLMKSIQIWVLLTEAINKELEIYDGHQQATIDRQHTIWKYLYILHLMQSVNFRPESEFVTGSSAPLVAVSTVATVFKYNDTSLKTTAMNSTDSVALITQQMRTVISVTEHNGTIFSEESYSKTSAGPQTIPLVAKIFSTPAETELVHSKMKILTPTSATAHPTIRVKDKTSVPKHSAVTDSVSTITVSESLSHTNVDKLPSTDSAVTLSVGVSVETTQSTEGMEESTLKTLLDPQTAAVTPDAINFTTIQIIPRTSTEIQQLKTQSEDIFHKDRKKILYDIEEFMFFLKRNDKKLKDIFAKQDQSTDTGNDQDFLTFLTTFLTLYQSNEQKYQDAIQQTFEDFLSSNNFTSENVKPNFLLDIASLKQKKQNDSIFIKNAHSLLNITHTPIDTAYILRLFYLLDFIRFSPIEQKLPLANISHFSMVKTDSLNKQFLEILNLIQNETIADDHILNISRLLKLYSLNPTNVRSARLNLFHTLHSLQNGTNGYDNVRHMVKNVLQVTDNSSESTVESSRLLPQILRLMKKDIVITNRTAVSKMDLSRVKPDLLFLFFAVLNMQNASVSDNISKTDFDDNGFRLNNDTTSLFNLIGTLTGTDHAQTSTLIERLRNASLYKKAEKYTLADKINSTALNKIMRRIQILIFLEEALNTLSENKTDQSNPRAGENLSLWTSLYILYLMDKIQFVTGNDSLPESVLVSIANQIKTLHKEDRPLSHISTQDTTTGSQLSELSSFATGKVDLMTTSSIFLKHVTTSDSESGSPHSGSMTELPQYSTSDTIEKSSTPDHMSIITQSVDFSTVSEKRKETTTAEPVEETASFDYKTVMKSTKSKQTTTDNILFSRSTKNLSIKDNFLQTNYQHRVNVTGSDKIDETTPYESEVTTPYSTGTSRRTDKIPTTTIASFMLPTSEDSGENEQTQTTMESPLTTPMLDDMATTELTSELDLITESKQSVATATDIQATTRVTQEIHKLHTPHQTEQAEFIKTSGKTTLAVYNTTDVTVTIEYGSADATNKYETTTDVAHLKQAIVKTPSTTKVTNVSFVAEVSDLRNTENVTVSGETDETTKYEREQPPLLNTVHSKETSIAPEQIDMSTASGILSTSESILAETTETIKESTQASNISGDKTTEATNKNEFSIGLIRANPLTTAKATYSTYTITETPSTIITATNVSIVTEPSHFQIGSGENMAHVTGSDELEETTEYGIKKTFQTAFNSTAGSPTDVNLTMNTASDSTTTDTSTKQVAFITEAGFDKTNVKNRFNETYTMELNSFTTERKSDEQQTPSDIKTTTSGKEHLITMAPKGGDLHTWSDKETSVSTAEPPKTIKPAGNQVISESTQTFYTQPVTLNTFNIKRLSATTVGLPTTDKRQIQPPIDDKTSMNFNRSGIKGINITEDQRNIFKLFLMNTVKNGTFAAAAVRNITKRIHAIPKLPFNDQWKLGDLFFILHTMQNGTMKPESYLKENEQMLMELFFNLYLIDNGMVRPENYETLAKLTDNGTRSSSLNMEGDLEDILLILYTLKNGTSLSEAVIELLRKNRTTDSETGADRWTLLDLYYVLQSLNNSLKLTDHFKEPKSLMSEKANRTLLELIYSLPSMKYSQENPGNAETFVKLNRTISTDSIINTTWNLGDLFYILHTMRNGSLNPGILQKSYRFNRLNESDTKINHWTLLDLYYILQAMENTINMPSKVNASHMEKTQLDLPRFLNLFFILYKMKNRTVGPEQVGKLLNKSRITVNVGTSNDTWNLHDLFFILHSMRNGTVMPDTVKEKLRTNGSTGLGTGVDLWPLLNLFFGLKTFDNDQEMSYLVNASGPKKSIKDIYALLDMINTLQTLKNALKIRESDKTFQSIDKGINISLNINDTKASQFQLYQRTFLDIFNSLNLTNNGTVNPKNIDKVVTMYSSRFNDTSLKDWWNIRDLILHIMKNGTFLPASMENRARNNQTTVSGINVDLWTLFELISVLQTLNNSQEMPSYRNASGPAKSEIYKQKLRELVNVWHLKKKGMTGTFTNLNRTNRRNLLFNTTWNLGDLFFILHTMKNGTFIPHSMSKHLQENGRRIKGIHPDWTLWRLLFTLQTLYDETAVPEDINKAVSNISGTGLMSIWDLLSALSVIKNETYMPDHSRHVWTDNETDSKYIQRTLWNMLLNKHPETETTVLPFVRKYINANENAETAISDDLKLLEMIYTLNSINNGINTPETFVQLLYTNTTEKENNQVMPWDWFYILHRTKNGTFINETYQKYLNRSRPVESFKDQLRPWDLFYILHTMKNGTVLPNTFKIFRTLNKSRRINPDRLNIWDLLYILDSMNNGNILVHKKSAQNGTNERQTADYVSASEWLDLVQLLNSKSWSKNNTDFEIHIANFTGNQKELMNLIFILNGLQNTNFVNNEMTGGKEPTSVDKKGLGILLIILNKIQNGNLFKMLDKTVFDENIIEAIRSFPDSADRNNLLQILELVKLITVFDKAVNEFSKEINATYNNVLNGKLSLGTILDIMRFMRKSMSTTVTVTESTIQSTDDLEKVRVTAPDLSLPLVTRPTTTPSVDKSVNLKTEQDIFHTTPMPAMTYYTSVRLTSFPSYDTGKAQTVASATTVSKVTDAEVLKTSEAPDSSTTNSARSGIIRTLFPLLQGEMEGSSSWLLAAGLKSNVSATDSTRAAERGSTMNYFQTTASPFHNRTLPIPTKPLGHITIWKIDNNGNTDAPVRNERNNINNTLIQRTTHEPFHTPFSSRQMKTRFPLEATRFMINIGVQHPTTKAISGHHLSWSSANGTTESGEDKIGGTTTMPEMSIFDSRFKYKWHLSIDDLEKLFPKGVEVNQPDFHWDDHDFSDIDVDNLHISSKVSTNGSKPDSLDLVVIQMRQSKNDMTETNNTRRYMHAERNEELAGKPNGGLNLIVGPLQSVDSRTPSQERANPTVNKKEDDISWETESNTGLRKANLSNLFNLTDKQATWLNILHSIYSVRNKTISDDEDISLLNKTLIFSRTLKTTDPDFINLLYILHLMQNGTDMRHIADGISKDISFPSANSTDISNEHLKLIYLFSLVQNFNISNVTDLVNFSSDVFHSGIHTDKRYKGVDMLEEINLFLNQTKAGRRDFQLKNKGVFNLTHHLEYLRLLQNGTTPAQSYSTFLSDKKHDELKDGKVTLTGGRFSNVDIQVPAYKNFTPLSRAENANINIIKWLEVLGLLPNISLKAVSAGLPMDGRMLKLNERQILNTVIRLQNVTAPKQMSGNLLNSSFVLTRNLTADETQLLPLLYILHLTKNGTDLRELLDKLLRNASMISKESEDYLGQLWNIFHVLAETQNLKTTDDQDRSVLEKEDYKVPGLTMENDVRSRNGSVLLKLIREGILKQSSVRNIPNKSSFHLVNNTGHPLQHGAVFTILSLLKDGLKTGRTPGKVTTKKKSNITTPHSDTSHPGLTQYLMALLKNNEILRFTNKTSFPRLTLFDQYINLSVITKLIQNQTFLDSIHDPDQQKLMTYLLKMMKNWTVPSKASSNGQPIVFLNATDDTVMHKLLQLILQETENEKMGIKLAGAERKRNITYIPTLNTTHDGFYLNVLLNVLKFIQNGTISGASSLRGYNRSTLLPYNLTANQTQLAKLLFALQSENPNNIRKIMSGHALNGSKVSEFLLDLIYQIGRGSTNKTRHRKQELLIESMLFDDKIGMNKQRRAGESESKNRTQMIIPTGELHLYQGESTAGTEIEPSDENRIKGLAVSNKPLTVAWLLFDIKGWTRISLERKFPNGRMEQIGTVTSRDRKPVDYAGPLSISNQSEFYDDKVKVVVQVPMFTCKDEASYNINVTFANNATFWRQDQIYVYSKSIAQLSVPSEVFKSDGLENIYCHAHLGYPERQLFFRILLKGENNPLMRIVSPSNYTVVTPTQCDRVVTVFLKDVIEPGIDIDEAIVQCGLLERPRPGPKPPQEGVVSSRPQLIRIIPDSVCESGKIRVRHPFSSCDFIDCDNYVSVVCPESTCFDNIREYCAPIQES